MSLHRSTPRMEPDPKLRAFVYERPDVPAAVRARADFFVFFAQTIYPKLEEQRSALDRLYCPTNGRPADDPVCLLGVLLLQFVERLPDRQAAEAACYDTRWRLALHLPETEGGFDPSLLPRFRQRLLAGQRARLAFDAILELLVSQGWLPRRSKQRLDSTHVCGLLSAMSRLGCVRETLRLALEELERHGSLPEFCAPLWECYVESKLDSRISMERVKAKTREAGEDARMLLAWSRQQGPAVHERQQMQLLARVFAENYELDETGACSVNRAQPAGAVHNPHESEAQWSSKSTTRDKSWTGYKAQVAETVQEEPRLPGEPTQSIITAVVTQNATESDQAGMAQVFRTVLQTRRREMQTEAFKQDMHHRNGIEGTQSELVRAYGLRHARYRGLAKVRLQNYFIGAACNIRRWFRRLAWETAQGLRPSDSITAVVAV